MERDARGARGREAIARLRAILFHRHVTAGRLGAAVGVGVFIGLTPFFGLHLPIALAAAWLLRLNVTATVLATQVTNPLLAPFLIAASAWIGALLGGGAAAGGPPDLRGAAGSGAPWWDASRPGFYAAWLRGGLALGAVLGTACGALTWAVAARLRRSGHA